MTKVPRTVEETLAQADELAARFETYEVKAFDELDASGVALLRSAVAELPQPSDTCSKPSALRQAGMLWSVIGSFVGTTGETARQRYASRVL